MLRAVLLRLFLSALLFTSVSALAGDWRQPTPQELSMTSEPKAPGAEAIFLYKEEQSDDNLHMHSVYGRLKILTEAGKKYADIEIYESRAFSVTDVAGRTIHSDGSIAPFTGKPFQKVIFKNGDHGVTVTAFAMPDAQVGSILEYRYKIRYDDNLVLPPQWFIQSDLYMAKAYYRFIPFGKGGNWFINLDHGQTSSGFGYSGILPNGVRPVQVRDAYWELNISDVPAFKEEQFAPPRQSTSYSVLFYYLSARTKEEYWKTEGKYWAKDMDKFIGPSGTVRDATAKLLAPGDNDEQKLKKIYAFVMNLENTTYTHTRSAAEDKAGGFRVIKNSEDILNRKRGNEDDMALLFVAMARAAGMHAYAMEVSDRDRTIFSDDFLTMSQLDDTIAIAAVNGQERFFDPGSKFCPFGQLEWNHTISRGLRQTAEGSAIAATPGPDYRENTVTRIAQLTLSPDGSAAGPIRLQIKGQEALSLRHEIAEMEASESEKRLEDHLKQMLPGGMTVKLHGISGKDDGEVPLVVDYNVSGPIATVTAHRLLIPAQLMVFNSRQLLNPVDRANAVIFHYAHSSVDQVELTLPPGVTVEDLPKTEDIPLEKAAVYRAKFEEKPNKIVVVRTFAMAQTVFPASDYTKVRTFYSQVRSKDEDQLVLKVGEHAAGN